MTNTPVVSEPLPTPAVDGMVDEAFRGLDAGRLHLDHWRHEELTVLPDFVPEPVVGRILHEVRELRPRLVRKRLFNYKNSGSISYHALRQAAPTVLALYNSPALIAQLSELADMELMTCPDGDAHSCAVYWYERAGDKCGYHTDNSWYRGARYTVLVRLDDASSARLHCKVYDRDPFRQTKDIEVSTTAGTFIFFNGDKLVHGVTPLGESEHRVVLSMQYVSDRRMGAFKRVINDLKDSLTYFGGREVFLGRPGGEGEPPKQLPSA